MKINSQIVYINGIDNNIADTMSHLECGLDKNAWGCHLHWVEIVCLSNYQQIIIHRIATKGASNDWVSTWVQVSLTLIWEANIVPML